MKTLSVICASILIAALCGCVSATATHTAKDGSADSVTVKGFLETIANGNYSTTNSNGTGMTLSTTSATPDQQSIAILAGTVGEIAKAGMAMAAKAPTNAPAANTNTLATPK